MQKDEVYQNSADNFPFVSLFVKNIPSEKTIVTNNVHYIGEETIKKFTQKVSIQIHSKSSQNRCLVREQEENMIMMNNADVPLKRRHSLSKVSLLMTFTFISENDLKDLLCVKQTHFSRLSRST